MNNLLDFLQKLISFPSITPHDHECQNFLGSYLEKIGFTVERFDKYPVSNLFAYIGQGTPFLIFAGHTDVVNPGPLDKWLFSPFQLTRQNESVYGRGVADMKGGLACMILAVEQFLLKSQKSFQGKIGFLITSAEEGDDFMLGTPWVMENLYSKNTIPTHCIIGEPSSNHKIADCIKIGRRGSLSGTLTIKGKQGHVAYPSQAENSIEKAIPVLQKLTQTIWDQGNEYFPATTFQITSINAGEGNNIIPGQIVIKFNLRFSTEQTVSVLKEKIHKLIHSSISNGFSIEWLHNGDPFITRPGKLIDCSQQAIREIMGYEAQLSTTGGTSDGRFIAPYGIEVIELGLNNATIHQVNENVRISDLQHLCQIYLRVCELFFKFSL